jgi:hypothetical protein
MMSIRTSQVFLLPPTLGHQTIADMFTTPSEENMRLVNGLQLPIVLPFLRVNQMNQRTGRPRISDRGHLSEAKISELHLGRFAAEGSAGLHFLETLCPGHDLTCESLVALARVCSVISGVQFPRDFTRRRDLVIKWFDDHLDRLEPLGCIMILEAKKIPAKGSDDECFLGHDALQEK